jgi:thiamine biosynthesis protein ThiI
LQEKVICLISGGTDSPIAAWFAVRKGLVPVFVYFDNAPFTDEVAKQTALDTIKQLVVKGVKVYVVDNGGNMAEIVKNCPRNLTCVLCRRMMFRVAEKIASKEGAKAIVTGEIIGEHASQTLTNLRVENSVLSKVTVLRPLIGMDKVEVEVLARKIGTFNALAKPASYCTAAPPKPRTLAKLQEVQNAELRLNIKQMIQRSLENMRVVQG